MKHVVAGQGADRVLLQSREDLDARHFRRERLTAIERAWFDRALTCLSKLLDDLEMPGTRPGALETLSPQLEDIRRALGRVYRSLGRKPAA
jgi:hypothetical protein